MQKSMINQVKQSDQENSAANELGIFEETNKEKNEWGWVRASPTQSSGWVDNALVWRVKKSCNSSVCKSTLN